MTIKTPVQDFLLKHASRNPISFHMPGHKGAELYRKCGYGEFLDNIFDCDITEIQGADNLFQAEGILKESQDRYSALYEVKKSYLQINGSSGGNIASILTAVPNGKKIVMARNSHKSCFNALSLGNIQPVYVYPEVIEEHGISGAIPPEDIATLLDDNNDAEAVILPSPNYYGICSDIKTIAEIVHKRGKILIVDQAHGAHLKFFSKYGIEGMPISAEEAGADLVVNSIHKTLASLTESALLNVNSERIDLRLLEDKLQQIESTSPSYLLMASLDINASILNEYGSQLFKAWEENLNCFYDNASKVKGLRYIGKIPGHDWTKINFSLGSLGIKGNELEQILLEKYNIFIELFTGDLVMCMTGIGNVKEDVEALVKALIEIAELQEPVKDTVFLDELRPSLVSAELCDIPTVRREISLDDADGCVCASSIIPYPPGIPFLCPGEKITAEAISYIKALIERGEKVIGVSETGSILVGQK